MEGVIQKGLVGGRDQFPLVLPGVMEGASGVSERPSWLLK